MTDVSMDVVIDQLLAVLSEGLEGPPENWSYFTDSRYGRASGLLGTLDRLSAAEASREVGGTSIAAHVHHVVFALDASAAWIRGERNPRDWGESWRVGKVDEAGWAGLQRELRDGYQELRQAIDAHAGSSLESVGGAIGAVAHLAYHLGAIRQKAAVIRLDRLQARG